jgi:hypothetical protein
MLDFLKLIKIGNFTKHELHYNRLGKQHLIYQITLKVYSLFEQKKKKPFPYKPRLEHT